VPGEGVGHPRPSVSRAFEDSQELGPAAASHDVIRNVGCGAFSHWGRQLYLSTSDNSDPNTNGRTYAMLAPAADEAARPASGRDVASMAPTPELLQAWLRASLSTQGAEFHAIYSLRALLSVLEAVGIDIAGKDVLEIGASPSHGLGIALALLGARKVIVNNVTSLSAELPYRYAENIAALTNLMRPLRRRLADVVTPPRAGPRGALSPELFELIPSTDAAALPARERPVDVAFSFSVLEHIRHLPAVLQRLRSVIAPGGVSVHWIDLRDHTDFTDPLKYLRWSESDFLAQYGAEHNRWRRPDYVRMFEDAGWQVVRQRVAGTLPTLDSGTTDMLAVAAEGPERIFAADAADLHHVRIALTDLDESYRHYSLAELSVMVVEVVARPAGRSDGPGQAR